MNAGMHRVGGQNDAGGQLPDSRLQNTHEVAFSLNLSLLFVAAFFVVCPYVPALDRVAGDLEAMDHEISRYLNVLPSSTGHLLGASRIPRDVVTGGYFAFFLPGIVLTLSLWALLRLLRRTQLVHEILRSLAGIVALCGAPFWRLWVNYLAGHWWWWSALVKVQFYEVVIVLCCAVAFFLGKWLVPAKASIALLLVHYGFWLWQFRFSFRQLMWGWGGSFAVLPIVGLFAGLTWALYVSPPRSVSFATAGGNSPIRE